MVRFKYSACGIGSVSMLNLWREIEWMNLWHKGYASAAYLHFLVSWTKFVEKSEESFGTEIPLTRGEELQYIQTITDTSLDATHAEIYILYISQKWSIEIGWFTRSYSQSWLAKTEHQEINDVGRHPLVEEQFQCMHEFVSGHVAAWIPDTGLKWIFVVQIPAKVKYFPPCNLLAVRAGHIEHRNVFRSANYVFFYFRLTSCILRYFVLISYSLYDGCTDFPCDWNQPVDSDVDWNNFRTKFAIAQHGSNYALSATDHDSNRAIETVNPSGNGLFPCRRNCEINKID